MDETLYAVADKVQDFAVIYLDDITDVPDFNKAGRTIANLEHTGTKNKHIMIDLGTGNNNKNKINWAMDNKRESSQAYDK
ncbi:hypothetical protein GSI_03452 [Ganoderma sinense ZZ0214-1]|uniref:Uncharacterized protein n=1 Tax=Ganoderma sinense ZZ0214-1 TaxID=1077348 RepID=A0A2G8SLP3_9APHY|nr:hypothetical protein GSI_03452 [Ganoderma sinense ZZ0214-1]